MRTIITATILSVAMATGASAQSARSDGTCMANQSGNILLTSVEYGDGYRVEAPWRVLASDKSQGSARMTAVLDHIIETDPVTQKRQRTPLPGAIEMTFEGENSTLMLREAANVWCATVAKALGARASAATIRAEQKRVVM